MSMNEKKHTQSNPPAGGRPGGRPGGPPGAPGEKPKDFKGSGKRLLHFLAPYKLQILFVMFFAAFSTIFGIVGPKVLALATDELANGFVRIVTGAEEGINFSYIGKILLILGSIYVVSALFNYFQNFIMAKITTKMSYGLRNDIEAKINRLPLSYFHTTSHGDVLSRITNDVDTLNTSLSNSITQMITSLCTIIGIIIMMLSINWKMTLISLCVVPISLILVVLVIKKSQHYFRSQQEYLGRVNGQVEEMYGGQLIVKAFGREKETIDQFEKENDKLYHSGWKSQFFGGIIQPIMGFVGNLGYVVMCMVGAVLASGGEITIGGIQAFIQYVRNFTQQVTQVSNITGQLQTTVAASERIFGFLEEQEEPEEQPTANTASMDIRGDVSFRNVRFGYENTEDIVIHDFSAEVKAGQTVAIVGPTGAGKTTVVKLLMRFHDLNAGGIYVDGVNITDFSRKDIRGEFGMVLQDAWLYSGTIMENIRYGNLKATDEEVIQAAKLAQADRFIRTLPGGYQMELNEESTNVSQGQRQLLTIARAILSDSKVLILDEATSSVDTRTEILIQKAMGNLMQGRTSFVIAHRLSTIRNADLILCMNNGDIVEQGTHDQLMKRNGFYADLYNSQFDKELVS